MPNKLRWLIAILPMLFASCYYHGEPTSDAWDMAQNGDSMSFYTTHHYSQNYNFIVKSDSLRISIQAPDELPFDSVTLYGGEHIVVADIMTMPGDLIDSVWVKVARDQLTQGWIHERYLLASVEPDDPISQFINLFSDNHILIFLALIVVVAAAYAIHRQFKRRSYIVHFNDIDTFFPSLLALVVAISATLYASIQMFAPESWRHFYYHPSLNPFAVPLHIGLFLASVWALLIIGLAALQEVVRRLPASESLLYLCSLAAVCAVDYVVFSISTLYYIGYVLLPAYIYFSVTIYLRHSHYRYVCGRCGEKLRRKGECPHCGAINN